MSNCCPACIIYVYIIALLLTECDKCKYMCSNITITSALCLSCGRCVVDAVVSLHGRTIQIVQPRISKDLPTFCFVLCFVVCAQ